VSTPGTYVLTLRVACVGQGGTFHLEMNGVNVSGPLTAPTTGGWQDWQLMTRLVTLTAGPQIARLVMDSMGTYTIANFDWLELTRY